jgi:hypothetical protein
MEPVTVSDFIEQIRLTHKVDILANCRSLLQAVNMITGQACPYKKAYTVSVSSYFLDMLNAQYMFASCLALLDNCERN